MLFQNLDNSNNHHLEDCIKRNFFEGKNVLEVGGNIPESITQQLNVKSWTCIDPSLKNAKSTNSNYSTINDYIEKFKNDEAYDFIISTDSFEHIQKLPEAFDNMYKLLKKGGILSSLAGCIWSCYKGHHVYIKHNNKLLTFNELEVPDWAHLLYSEDECRKILTAKYDDDLTKKILYQMYHWDFLNHIFYDDYINIINNSKFKIIELRDWHTSKYPDKQTQLKLENLYNNKNFSTVSIKMILEK